MEAYKKHLQSIVETSVYGCKYQLLPEDKRNS